MSDSDFQKVCSERLPQAREARMAGRHAFHCKLSLNCSVKSEIVLRFPAARYGMECKKSKA